MADKKLIYETKEALYARALRAMGEEHMIVQYAFKIENYEKAAELFEQLGDYEEAAAYAAQCREKAMNLRAQEQEYGYEQAVTRQESAQTASEYDRAAELFQELNGYRDAEERMQQCMTASNACVRRRQRSMGFALVIVIGIIALLYGFFHSSLWARAKADIMDEVYIDPSLPAWNKEQIAIRAAKKGTTVSFAQMDWYVLAKNDTEALLIAKPDDADQELAYHPYHDTKEAVTWETSHLRAWLNDGFLTERFTPEEQQLLVPTRSETGNNRVYDTDGGNTVEDLVKIPSAREAIRYQSVLTKLKADCWLRTPGSVQDTAACLSARAEVLYYGCPVNETKLRVCPMITVSLQ